MMRLRLLPGLVAAATLLAAPAVSAQQLAARDVPVEFSADHAPGGVHILTVRPDGSVGCDVASEVQATALRGAEEAAGTVRLTPLPSLNRAGTGFHILIRATDQLLANPPALLAFRRAAARWEQLIQTNVTTVIDLDYGPKRFGTTYPSPNILGSTNSAQDYIDYTAATGSAEVRAALAARQTNPALLALVNAIPTPTPSTLVTDEGPTSFGRAIGGIINLQVLGFRPPVTSVSAGFGSVPNIGFNSTFAYDFNPRDGIDPSQTDFEALAVHEIGHALGFTSAIGGATVDSPYFTPWDLYRVRPETVTPGEPYTDGVGWEVTQRVLSPGPTIAAGLPANQVMFVGDAEYELATSRGDGTGGDGNQASHWRADELSGTYVGIMDPSLARGDREEITAADLRALRLFGYTVSETLSSASAALAIDGTPVSIDFLTPTVQRTLPLAGGTVAIRLSNTGGPDALVYDAEVVVRKVESLTPGFVPALTLASASGTVAPGAGAALDLTVGGTAGGAVIKGEIVIHLNDVSRSVASVPFTISIGAPSVALTAAPATVTVPSGTAAPVTLDIRNAGDAPLSYVRVLEPAASNPATAQRSLAGDGAAAGGPVAEPADLPDGSTFAARAAAQLAIPGAAVKLYDIAQLPSGDILAVDGGTAATTTIYQAPADLSAVTATYTSAATFGGQVTGLAFNTKTGTLWIAVQETGLVREVRLDGTAIVPTGVAFQTRVAPFGLDYSPELDAFVFGEFSTSRAFVMDATGTLLPGYPVSVEGRASGATPTPGLSFTEGLLEMTSFSSRIFQADMFGRAVAGTPATSLPISIYGLQRSTTDPGGTIYVSSRSTSAGATIRSLVASALPATVGTRLDAGEPFYSKTLVPPGGVRTLALIADARNLPQGTAVDELVFLTNAPNARLVRFPVTINVGAVAGEAGPDAALDGVSLWPNPASGAARVRLTLSAPADVSVAVYNTLGQRVAVLAEGAALAPGTTDLALDTARLAAGVYVVRVTAGASITTQKLTVVR